MLSKVIFQRGQALYSLLETIVYVISQIRGSELEQQKKSGKTTSVDP
jgi:hypothetical protein